MSKAGTYSAIDFHPKTNLVLYFFPLDTQFDRRGGLDNTDDRKGNTKERGSGSRVFMYPCRRKGESRSALWEIVWADMLYRSGL